MGGAGSRDESKVTGSDLSLQLMECTKECWGLPFLRGCISKLLSRILQLLSMYFVTLILNQNSRTFETKSNDHQMVSNHHVLLHWARQGLEREFIPVEQHFELQQLELVVVVVAPSQHLELVVVPQQHSQEHFQWHCQQIIKKISRLKKYNLKKINQSHYIWLWLSLAFP